MNFKKFKINSDDFSFYESLPDTERILFLYDLICEGAYGDGSLSIDEPTQPSHETKFDLDSFIDENEEKLSMLFEIKIDERKKCNLVFLHDLAIINTNKKKEILNTANDLASKGFLIVKLPMTLQWKRIFHKQKYCAVYRIIGLTQQVSNN